MSESPEISSGKANDTERRLTLMGGLSRKGRWTVRPRTLVVTLVGGMDLDLTQAEFVGDDVTITLCTAVGGADITVPAHVDVVVEGFNVLGGRNLPPAATGPTSVTLRLRSYSLIGGVDVHRT